MVIQLAIYFLILITASFVCYFLYNKVPVILYPILAKMTGEDLHARISRAEESAKRLQIELDRKDQLVLELDLSAQAHGSSEITHAIDKFKRENPNDSLHRRY